MPSSDLVTGGTGLLGSHIAERLVAAGRRVRALVRPGSDTRFLQGLGVELVQGDLIDPAACARAVAGVEVVYHAAAKVGDWGRWEEFLVNSIDATRRLAEASARAGVARFLHVSSTSAYGHPPDGSPPVVETDPLGRNVWPWDPYTRSKVETERLLGEFQAAGTLAVTVVRPSWLYGERDRTTVARVVDRLRQGNFPIVGRGDNPLSAVYAGTVADAALLAARDPASAGEAYNITRQGPITQTEFFHLFAAACGAPAPRRHVPYPVLFALGFLMEGSGRLIRRKRPPPMTRYAAWLMGRRLEYSTAKAETRLGWRPALSYRESIERTVQWYLQNE